MYQIEINPGKLSLKQLRHISRHKVTLSLNNAAYDDMLASTQAVEQVIAEDRVVYGINTE